MSKNDDAKEWNEALAEGETLLADMRARAIRTRHGFMRRVLLRLINWTDRWVKTGRRWRNQDLAD